MPDESPVPVERPTRLVHAPIITVQQHILREQRRFAGVSGEFSWLLSGITLATKLIEAKVRRAGLSDILGEAGEINVQGEVQQRLDVYANEMLVHALSVRESVAMITSEENEQPLLAHGGSPHAKYIVVFDPLDGSSNIDVCGSVGTTFSILCRTAERLESDVAPDEVLQPGHKQIAAGYVVYGPSTVLVYSAGNGVHGFTLDPAVGAFVLSHPNIRMPEQGKYYSMNEAYLDALRAATSATSRSCATAAWDGVTRRATSARWSPIFTARCSKGACFSTRRPTTTRKASSACCTKPTPSPSSPSTPAARPPAARPPAARRILDIQPKASTAHAAGGRWQRGAQSVRGGDGGGVARRSDCAEAPPAPNQSAQLASACRSLPECHRLFDFGADAAG